MKLITPKYIRFFDETVGQTVILPCQMTNHMTKTRRGKEFIPTCGNCDNATVWPVETHIQHGFDVDKHWYYVYCDLCKTVTIHHYEVSDNGD